MEAKLLPDFSVQGTYGERRRKDVSFLNTVALKLKTSTIHLGQGGRVTEGDTVLTLTEEKKVVGKVALVRTAAGVTATYSDQSFEVVVFFNGYTAQIDITGPPSTDLGLKHLCATAASPEADVRATTGSCEKKHQDDPPISCDKSKSSCGILKDAPFTSCHSHVKPDAFVTACSNMMCRYPAVDELTCNFLEAYTRACSLYSTTAVTGWRSKASCPESPKALCQDMPCGSQEFCGQLEGGSWSCLCRPIFTQQYRDSGSLGDATTCGAGSASASLINCLLEEKGIDYTTLQLKDNTCKGELIDGMAVFKFDNSKPCGAEVTDNNGAVNYKNHIQSKEMPADGIIHHSPVDIPFACDFAEPKLQLMSFKVSSSSSVVNKPVESGSYEYGITMKAFSNEARTEDLKSVGLNQRIWIELKATGVDSKMVSVLFDSCWATKKADPESDPKYYLVSKGCRNPEDPSVLLDGNGAGTLSVFSFETFQFTDSKSEVFLHCKVKMCSKKKDKTCVPDCKSRKRRSLDAAADSSLLTMSWAGSSD
ncbi:uncharacterized protein LOC117808948 [Notolabrus celidotus]|uniref:uncharacterized protein LOC117808948 n=1 Tax=Notolabrus celidotus TaxID=1203425 RepID=UPI00148FFBC3|nr:uncharacterized protein LOC117808948 [Notolabrus celidotus]